MYEFGSGTLFGFPSIGNTAANPTPMKFGTLQDVSLDISGDIKQLYGQKQFPEAVARGKNKISGKAKFAHLNGKLFNDLYFGQTMGSGMITMALDQAGTIPATPFQLTVTNSANFKQDWGVTFVATGVPLTKVTGTPAAGQYSEAAGVYTFAAADTGSAVLISYTWTNASVGTQLNITNQLMGFAPTIQILLEQQYNSNQESILCYAAVASKLSFATKQEDFLIPEFDFECFANASGQVIDIYSQE